MNSRLCLGLGLLHGGRVRPCCGGRAPCAGRCLRLPRDGRVPHDCLLAKRPRLTEMRSGCQQPSVVVSAAMAAYFGALVGSTLFYSRPTAAEAAPNGLVAQWKGTPSLGVDWRAPLHYAWIVPHVVSERCPRSGQVQAAYHVQVAHDKGHFDEATAAAGHVPRGGLTPTLIWDSGRIPSEFSHRVPHPANKPLLPGTRYWWRVRTWASENCSSDWSAAATMVTATDFSSVNPIWAPGDNVRFALLRKVCIADGVCSCSTVMHRTSVVVFRC